MENAERFKILRLLYGTIFFTATGLGTCTFFLPVYAETLGASYTDLGLIGAVGNVVYTVITLVCGYVLDRLEKIRLYTVFNIFGCIVIFLFIFTETISQVILLRGLIGAASATFWVSASTLTADISPREELTRSLGRYNLAWILGFIVGPYMGGLISYRYGYDIFFLVSGGVIVVSIGLIFLGIRGKIELKRSYSNKKHNIGLLKPLTMSYLTLVPFSMVLGIYMAIIPGHMKVVGLTASLIGILLTLTNGVRGFLFFYAERLVEWGTRFSIFTASILLALSMLIIRTGDTALGFGVPLIFYGAGSGIMTPVVLIFIIERTPERLRGTAMGVHEAIYGVGMSLGPLIGGAIADTLSAFILYSVMAVVSLSVLPLAFFMTQKTTP